MKVKSRYDILYNRNHYKFLNKLPNDGIPLVEYFVQKGTSMWAIVVTLILSVSILLVYLYK